MGVKIIFLKALHSWNWAFKNWFDYFSKKKKKRKDLTKSQALDYWNIFSF